MTYINIVANFEKEINKIDDQINKPKTDDSLYWLNQAVQKFCKTRFNRDFVHLTSYEQNEKRRIDLENLYKSYTWNYIDLKRKTAQPSYDEYDITYPSDFMFRLNEDVVIADNAFDHKMNTNVFECTKDSFMYRITNNLTDFHYKYHKARPIRITNSTGCKLLTDKNYVILEYTLGYLRKPNEITLIDPFKEYTDFKDIVITEIIKMAAQMYIENQIDQKQSNRYQTITNEVNTQE